MISALRSIWIWSSTVTLIFLWLPLLATIRLFDRDPVRYRTGRWFRRLGKTMTDVNPSVQLQISGEQIDNPRRPYVVVSNHQSLADIPIISNLPWEMKWIAKDTLFRVPFVGWMMTLAGDISVDRASKRAGAQALLAARRYLEQKCSVIFFPEGTRSPDGRVAAFADGAFHMAVNLQIPVLPLAVEGAYKCLPKKSWRFGKTQKIFLKVLPPLETTGMTKDDVPALRERVRRTIVAQIASWRGVDAATVDHIKTEQQIHTPATTL